MWRKGVLLFITTSGLITMMWFYCNKPIVLSRGFATYKDGGAGFSKLDTQLISIRRDTTWLKPDDTIEAEREYSEEEKQTSQYKLLVARKRQMKIWARQYIWVRLPDKAEIIEERKFETRHGGRTLLAWMLKPYSIVLNNYDIDDEEINQWWYGIRGSGYFEGRLGFTLVDVKNSSQINSTNFTNYYVGCFDDTHYSYDEVATKYPYAMANPKYGRGNSVYVVNGGSKTEDGVPDIMHFFDFNGDGKPFEFLIYNRETSHSTEGALFGYNEGRDSFYAYNWYNTAYKIDTPGRTPITTEEMYDYANDFSLVKKIKHGRVTKDETLLQWTDISEEYKLDSSGTKVREYFMGEFIDMPCYVYEKLSYDSTNNKYSWESISIPINR